jgi:hypothetical protein
MAIIPADEKVFMVSKSTNTTYSGSASLKAMQEWYTMQDISDSIVAPYKVFTALLTQSGGSSNEEVDGDGGSIAEGVTYYVNANPDNFDLTIYGAPNNDEGTYFIANQDATLPYTYTLQLYYNTGAPIATILENTIGNIWFTYEATGRYIAISNGLFVDHKTAKFGGWADLDIGAYFRFGNNGDNNSAIYLSTGDPAAAESYLQNTTIEIRVYN